MLSKALGRAKISAIYTSQAGWRALFFRSWISQRLRDLSGAHPALLLLLVFGTLDVVKQHRV